MAFISFTKFRVTFRGEDVGILDADTVTMDHALQLEDKTGFTLQELVPGVGRGSAKAIRALVWFQLLRAGKPQDLHQDFTFADFDVDPVTDEPDPTKAAKGGKNASDPAAPATNGSETDGTGSSPS